VQQIKIGEHGLRRLLRSLRTAAALRSRESGLRPGIVESLTEAVAEQVGEVIKCLRVAIKDGVGLFEIAPLFQAGVLVEQVREEALARSALSARPSMSIGRGDLTPRVNDF